MDAAERAKVRQLIEAVLAADNVVSAEEKEFLGRVLRRFNLGEGDGGEVLSTDPGRATQTLKALSPDSQSRVMALLVEAAVVDRRVVPEEHALLLAAAAALGIDAVALEERIARRLRSEVPAF